MKDDSKVLSVLFFLAEKRLQSDPNGEIKGMNYGVPQFIFNPWPLVVAYPAVENCHIARMLGANDMELGANMTLRNPKR